MKYIISILFFSSLLVVATTWEDITNPDTAISIINLTTNDIYISSIKFRKSYTNDLGNTEYITNDLGLFLSREEINAMIFQIYQQIQSQNFTNLTTGHVPVSNF